jgi:hypothetical protein
MNESPVERRLSELHARTQALGPRPGFQARVLDALAARARATLRSEVVSSARFFVPVAFLLAVISVGLASRADAVSSVDFAVAERQWELDW